MGKSISLAIVLSLFLAFGRSYAQAPLPPAPPQPAPPQTPALAAPGYLGLVADNATEEDGVVVLRIQPGGPSDAVGIQPGDFIREANGKKIKQIQQLVDVVEQLPVGGRLLLTLSREDQRFSKTVFMGRRADFETPPSFPEPHRHEKRTLPAERPAGKPPTLAPGLRPLLGINMGDRVLRGSGVLVQGVVPGMAAERAGVPVGATIIALNRQPVASAQELVKVLDTLHVGQRVSLTYRLPGQQAVRTTVSLTDAAQPQPGPRALRNLERGLESLIPSRRDAAERQQLHARIEAMERFIEQLERRITHLEDHRRAPPKP